MFDRKQQNSVKQLSFNKKINKKKSKGMLNTRLRRMVISGRGWEMGQKMTQR